MGMRITCSLPPVFGTLPWLVERLAPASSFYRSLYDELRMPMCVQASSEATNVKFWKCPQNEPSQTTSIIFVWYRSLQFHLNPIKRRGRHQNKNVNCTVIHSSLHWSLDGDCMTVRLCHGLKNSKVFLQLNSFPCDFVIDMWVQFSFLPSWMFFNFPV